ncbi:hypothetical protein DE4576_03131 [Mycobacterium marinum]|nr:hypothetical protein DE4576_03131 [Mycobacterium marinum]
MWSSKVRAGAWGWVATTLVKAAGIETAAVVAGGLVRVGWLPQVRSWVCSVSVSRSIAETDWSVSSIIAVKICSRRCAKTSVVAKSDAGSPVPWVLTSSS